jgi:signal peptide peptidase SppA
MRILTKIKAQMVNLNRYSRILTKVFGAPWDITPGGHDSVQKVLERGMGLQDREPGTGVCGDAVDVAQPVVIGDVAVIPVNGVLANGIGAAERGAGVVDYFDIAREVQEFDADPAISKIILDIDSPGGTHEGSIEAARAISRATTPITAITSGLMASAAYEIAAAASRILATPTATVGSIGSMIGFLDQSRAFSAAGFKVEMIVSGPNKGAGMPGTSLSPVQRKQFQDLVDAAAGQFKAHVMLHRPQVSESAMDGAIFTSAKALELGLLDGIVESKSEVIPATPAVG